MRNLEYTIRSWVDSGSILEGAEEAGGVSSQFPSRRKLKQQSTYLLEAAFHMVLFHLELAALRRVPCKWVSLVSTKINHQ